MMIRAAISAKNNNQAKLLADKLIAFSINTIDKDSDIEFDISFFRDDFLKLESTVKNIDIAFISYYVLEENVNILNRLYHENPSCVSIPVGKPCEKLCDFLMLRPAGYLDTFSDEKNISSLCLFCASEISNNKEILQIKSRTGTYSVSLSSVVFCQSDKKYISIISEDGKIFRKLGKLDQITEILPDYFVRIHQSFIVNSRMVSGLDKTTWEVITLQGERLPVSRIYHQAANDLFKNTFQA